MAEGIILFGWIFGILVAFVNLAFAIGVFIEAADLRFVRRKVYFVGPLSWAFATLLGGIFVVAVFWLIHNSTLNPAILTVKKQLTESDTE